MNDLARRAREQADMLPRIGCGTSSGLYRELADALEATANELAGTYLVESEVRLALAEAIRERDEARAALHAATPGVGS